MPRPEQSTKVRIVDAAYKTFYKEGFARARVDAIADAAGVTKRTFYYHFDSKDAILAAVLEAQHELVLKRTGEWATRAAGDPATMIRILFAELSAWANTPAWQGSGFTRSVMELADLPGHPVRAIARRHKAAIEAWLTEQLRRSNTATPEIIARQIMLLIEGCHSLILIHGDPDYAGVAAEAAVFLVERAGPGGPTR